MFISWAAAAAAAFTWLLCVLSRSFKHCHALQQTTRPSRPLITSPPSRYSIAVYYVAPVHKVGSSGLEKKRGSKEGFCWQRCKKEKKKNAVDKSSITRRWE